MKSVTKILHTVECWENGKDYDDGKIGKIVNVMANNEKEAEHLVFNTKEYDVVQYLEIILY